MKEVGKLPNPKKRYVITNDREYACPPLRISPYVHGRVRYNGRSRKKAIAEEIVLQRWIGRVHDRLSFFGSRLNPNFWRHLPIVLGDNISSWRLLNVEGVSELISLAREVHPDIRKFPRAETIVAMIQFLGTTN